MYCVLVQVRNNKTGEVNNIGAERFFKNEINLIDEMEFGLNLNDGMGQLVEFTPEIMLGKATNYFSQLKDIKSWGMKTSNYDEKLSNLYKMILGGIGSFTNTIIISLY